jgi:hypothetical protein
MLVVASRAAELYELGQRNLATHIVNNYVRARRRG